MARRIACSALILFALFLTGCDHATKAIAKASLRGVVTIVPGVFDLRYTENRDTAFGLFARGGLGAQPLLLAIVPLAISIAVSIVWWRRRAAPVVEQVGYTLVLGGALGNVIDRLLRGYVIDFMHLHRWPVFNVADMAVVAGAAVLGIASIRADRARRRARPGPASG